MHGKLLLHLQSQRRGARLRAGSDDGINLPVATLVRRVQLLLEDEVVEQHVGAQAGQRGAHVLLAVEMVSLHGDLRELRLRHHHLHIPVGDRLHGQAHRHRHVTAPAIGQLQFAERGADLIHADDRPHVISKNFLQQLLAQERVALHLIAQHAEARPVCGAGHGGRGGIGGRRDRRRVQTEQPGHEEQHREHGRFAPRRTTAGGVLFLVRVGAPPFAGGHAEAFFEHGVEESQVPVAALIGDGDDFILRVGEELPRLLQTQLGLLGPDGSLELLAKHAAEMAQAAPAHLGQFLRRVVNQVRVRDARDDLLEAQQGGGHVVLWLRHGRERVAKNHRHQMQNAAAVEEAPPLAGVAHQFGVFPRDGVRRRDDARLRRLRETFQREPLRERHQPDQMFRIKVEKMQRRRANLAGPQHAFAARSDDQHIARLQIPRLGSRDPVEETLGDQNDLPARRGIFPLCARQQFTFVQKKVRQEFHCGSVWGAHVTAEWRQRNEAVKYQ